MEDAGNRSNQGKSSLLATLKQYPVKFISLSLTPPPPDFLTSSLPDSLTPSLPRSLTPSLPHSLAPYLSLTSPAMPTALAASYRPAPID